MASTKPSALLDTCVIYCGDNGTMRPHCDDHASHYVKVRLDEILGERASVV